jgi:DNA-binding IclR family transcriptional regulator
MLGEGGFAECHRYAERNGLPSYTPNTIVDADRLAHEAETAKNAGYALDNEEAELGVACIGVLIRDASGEAVAGLSISAPRDRHESAWIDLLIQAGNRLSKRLGYGGPRKNPQKPIEKGDIEANK